MKAKGDVSGNARASELQFQEEMLRLGMQVARAERIFNSLFDDDIRVSRFSVKVPLYEGGEFLIVITAMAGGRGVVAFHSSPGFSDSVRGALARLENRSVSWKDDEYANRDNGAGGHGGEESEESN